ncbi:hypothetical protein ZEAMMB73_Zm00001d029404 [Zea mays]|uniref:Uncharacterized protein n=1 Tax=Zea mays TaxID=4577 RepID=A0A1D6K4Y1_MAIZE|nr:hypothetical protein ZEAMMB73_Zm00001d029404 [Zea mays]
MLRPACKSCCAPASHEYAWCGTTMNVATPGGVGGPTEDKGEDSEAGSEDWMWAASPDKLVLQV